MLCLAARYHRTCQRFRLRAHSAPLRRTTLALEPARVPEIAARARSAPLDRRRFKWAGPRILLRSTQRRTFGARVHTSIIKVSFGARASGPLSGLSRHRPCSKTPHLPTFATFEPARLRCGARNGRSSPLGFAGALEMAARARSAPLGRPKWPLEPARRRRQGARNGRSSPLGSAGALETAARARSAPLGRSKWLLELARLRQGARNCSTWLLENTASADVSEVEPARLRWGARHRSSSLLGSAGPETLHWAGPRMLASLNRETNILVYGMHGSARV